MRVNAPNGDIVEYPDDAPPDQVKADIAANHSSAQAPPAMSAFKNFLSNFGQMTGLSSVADLPANWKAMRESGAGLSDIPRAAEDISAETLGQGVKGVIDNGMAFNRIMQGKNPEAGRGTKPYIGPPSALQALAKYVGVPALGGETAQGIVNAVPGGGLLTTPPEAMGRGLAAALPIFGPLAAKAGEQFGRGDVSGGLGSAAGLIGTALMPTRSAVANVAGDTTKSLQEAMSALRAGRRAAARGGAEAVAPALAPEAAGVAAASQGVGDIPAIKPPAAADVVEAPQAGAAPPGAVAGGAEAPPPPDSLAQYPGPEPVNPNAAPVTRPVPLSLGQKLNSPGILRLEATLRQVPLAGSGPFDRLRVAANTVFPEYADAIVQDIAGKAQVPGHADIADMLATAIPEARDNIRGVLNATYKSIDEMAQSNGLSVEGAGGANAEALAAASKQWPQADLSRLRTLLGEAPPTGGVDISPIRQAAKKSLGEQKLQQQEGMVPPSWDSGFSKDLQAIANGPDRVSFSSLHQFRSNARAAVREQGTRLPDQTAGLERKFAAMADTALNKAASGASPELAAKLRQADALSRQYHFDFDNTLARKLAEQVDSVKAINPAEITPLVLQSNPAFIEALRRNLSPQNARLLGARAVRDVLDRSMNSPENVDLLKQYGESVGMSSNAAASSVPAFRAGSLSSAISKVPDETWNALLQPNQVTGLKLFSKVLSQSQLTGQALLNRYLNFAVWGSTTMAVTHFEPSIAVLGGATLGTGMNILARVLTKPGGATAAAKALQATMVFPGQPSKWGAFGAQQFAGMWNSAAKDEAREPLAPPASSDQQQNQSPPQ